MKPTVLLKSLSCTLPSRHLPNGDPAFKELADVPAAWFDFWGIESRQVIDTAKGESELGLACEVADKALRQAGVDASQIDMIFANITSPFVSTDGSPAGRQFAPRLSGLLKRHLGAERALNMDIEAECASFMFQMQMASNFIRQGRIKHALVCSTEWMSSLLDYSCKSAITFGDGAAAAVLSAGDEDSPYDLLDAVYRSDGEHFGLATAKWRYPRSLEAAGEEAMQRHPEKFASYFTLKTQTKDEIARFMPETIPDMVERLLKKTGLHADDIDAMVFHQPAKTLVNGWAKSLGLGQDRYVVKLADCACLASVSVPIALYESIRRGIVKPGSLVVLAGAGAGWSFGAQLWRVGPIAIGEHDAAPEAQSAPRASDALEPGLAEA